MLGQHTRVRTATLSCIVASSLPVKTLASSAWLALRLSLVNPACKGPALTSLPILWGGPLTNLFHHTYAYFQVFYCSIQARPTVKVNHWTRLRILWERWDASRTKKYYWRAKNRLVGIFSLNFYETVRSDDRLMLLPPPFSR